MKPVSDYAKFLEELSDLKLNAMLMLAKLHDNKVITSREYLDYKVEIDTSYKMFWREQLQTVIWELENKMEEVV